jgi:hypothetical protein
LEKGEDKMSELLDHDAEVGAFVARCDAEIEKLKGWATEAPPELQKKLNDDIADLIANREAARRGLLPISSSGEALCSTCSEEDS